MTKTKCYNSGKIGGLPYLVAYKKFQKADEDIFLMDMNPINPMKSGLKYSRPWWMHMIVDVCLLLRCQCVYVQTDWKESRGARIEMKLAKLFGKTILFEQEKEEYHV